MKKTTQTTLLTGLKKAALFFTLLAFLLPTSLKADFPAKPNPPRLVNDFTGTLNQQDANFLEGKLEEYARKTSTRIVVVLVNSLDGYDAGQYAFSLGEKWGVGDANFDNGIVVLVKPTGDAGSRKVFIAVGYGLEGVIPDITAKQIVDREIIPEFKKGSIIAGLDKGTTVLMQLAAKEYAAKDYTAKKGQKKGFGIGGIITLVILYLIFSRIFGGNRSNIGRKGMPWYMWLLLGNSMGGSRGNWNDFNSGGGGFGGGGGGFGGFGGGSFGGGGAGGSW